MSQLGRLITRKNDHGASAILVAGALVLLMGFAAIAVDWGILFNDRRQQQSAADGGALAAVQFAKTTLGSSICADTNNAAEAACRGAEEAIDVVAGTLDGRYSSADWLNCSDPSRPAQFTVISSPSPCVSYTGNFQEARVVLPGTDVATTFGRVIGTNSVRVTAFAHAKVDIEQSADILPFAVGPTGAGAAQACLFAQSTANLNISPCVSGDSGNYGKLDLSLYGNTTLGTNQICGNASPQVKMAVNIAVGSDHIFELASDSPGTVMEVANCPTIPNPVDNIPVQTGNAAQGISNGLFYGISTPALEGRIMCKDGDSGELPGKTSNGNCENVWNQFPERLDDNPLWRYIDGSNQLSGGACPSSGISDRAGMLACLNAWKSLPNGTVNTSLFTDSLRTAPRFAAVPVLISDPSGGTGDYDIIEFKPVYLETIYMKCNANTCDTVHSPGESNPAPPAGPNCPAALTPATSHCGVQGNGNANAIEALTSFMLDMDMLPTSITDSFPNQPGTVVFNLSR